MQMEEIVALMIEEREKLSRAIDILQPAEKPKRGRKRPGAAPTTD